MAFQLLIFIHVGKAASTSWISFMYKETVHVVLGLMALFNDTQITDVTMANFLHNNNNNNKNSSVQIYFLLFF